uniref:Protein kinase domain-containing protein n=1 Tax=Gadus morhua TaxID=8049 RepID=A0A8C5FS03_GADMO
MENYEVLKVLGSGGFGEVLKYTHLILQRELAPLLELKHDNVIKLLTAFLHRGLMHAVFELLDHNIVNEIMHRHIKAEAPLSSHSCDDSSSGVSNLLDPACSWLDRLRFLLLHLSVWGPVIVGSLKRVRPCDWTIDLLGAGDTKKKKCNALWL